MKRPLAILLACLIMGGMFWTGLRRPGSSARDSSVSRTRADRLDGQSGSDLSGASERIESLLEGARQGDLTIYLQSFDGRLRTRLERQADERGRAAFAADLQRAAVARKSHAVFAPEPDGDPARSARIVVESTFADRIERQTYRLVRADSSWFITDVETARDHVPSKALGSLASFQEPEGVPVATDQTARVPIVEADPEED
jgi:hypothetical protein